jgi:hypothetical protein
MSEIEAQGTVFAIKAGIGAAENITDITLGAITKIELTATARVKGDVVTLASIVGTTDLNGVTAMVIAAETNAIYLDIDSTEYDAYTSGGTATPNTYTTIGEIKGWSRGMGSRPERDVTDLADDERIFSPGLFERGQVSVDVKWSHTDVGFLAVLAAHAAGEVKEYKVTYSDAEYETFNGFVLSAEETGQVGELITGSITLRIYA